MEFIKIGLILSIAATIAGLVLSFVASEMTHATGVAAVFKKGMIGGALSAIVFTACLVIADVLGY